MWLSGNLKPWRQSCPPPPPAKSTSAPGPRAAGGTSEAKAPLRVLEQNALGGETGKENAPVTAGEGGRREQAESVLQERMGGGRGNNGRNFYFSSFAEKPAGDWVVGEEGDEV